MSRIFEELTTLNLPAEHFVVVGSGILAALGIRDFNDIDILATPELFEKLKQSGWKYEIWNIDGCEREKVSRGQVEVYKDFRWQDGSMTPAEALANTEHIQGFNFLPLSKLLEIKKSMGREKDKEDIVLIEHYLQSSTNPN